MLLKITKSLGQCGYGLVLLGLEAGQAGISQCLSLRSVCTEV